MWPLNKIRAIFRRTVSADVPCVRTIRDGQKQTAIILIHGFHGHTETTWGKMPQFLAAEVGLQEWDIHAVGYRSGLMPDVRGIWAADASIEKLALLLGTVTEANFAHYKVLIFLAHSMGGLVVQRALLDSENLTNRTSHIFLFGTPSAGLDKASLFGVLKRQVGDMASGSRFISQLRTQWDERFSTPPFRLRVSAGDRDEFVSAASSLAPFPETYRRVVPGNHVEIVKPDEPTHPSVRLVVETIRTGAAVLGLLNSATLAVEQREFRTAIDLLEPNAGSLDESGLVQLALAYDGVDRRADALHVLQQRGENQTDAMGTLAGRLKRRWIVERREADAKRAMQLYGDGMNIALRKSDWDQAYYHSVNVAFLKLAFERNRHAAMAQATTTLDYCSKAVESKWRFASEGEAHLILGEREAALAAYRNALQFAPRPREAAAMLRQAMWTADLNEDLKALRNLEDIFQSQGLAEMPITRVR